MAAIATDAARRSSCCCPSTLFFFSFFSFSCVCLSDKFGASFLPLSRYVASLVITFAIVATTTFVADSFFLSLRCLIHSCASNTTTSLLDWLFIRFVLNCRRITLDRYDLLLCCRLTIVSIIPYAKWCGCHFSRSHPIAVSLSKNDDIIYINFISSFSRHMHTERTTIIK